MTCSVDLIYKGWNAYALPGQGYTDTKKVTLTFYMVKGNTPPKSIITEPEIPDAHHIPPTPTSTENDDTSPTTHAAFPLVFVIASTTPTSFTPLLPPMTPHQDHTASSSPKDL